MASLLIVRRGADIVAQCDAHCYLAKHDNCDCKACLGRNHGVGYERAVINTRALAAGWPADDGTTVELDDSVHHEPLFTLPQDNPMTEPHAEAPDSDQRFTIGFIYDIHKVLEEHGYKPPPAGPDGDESARNLAYGHVSMYLYRLVRAFEGIED